MKKTFYLIAMIVASFAFSACSSDDAFETTGTGGATATIPSTKVTLSTSKSNGFGATLLDNTVETEALTETADAYFYIRIDNSIPGSEKLESDPVAGASKDYFPQTAKGASVFTELNKGTVIINSELYQEGNGAIVKFVNSEDGSLTKGLIVKAPTIADLAEADNSGKIDLSQLTDDKYEIVWYTVFKRKDDQKWHVDGLLRAKPAPKFYNGEVEVDIHQQTHETWDEIKTSIHVRDTVTTTVTIPIEEGYLAEADDFRIRTFEGYYEIGDAKYPVDVKIEHTASAIIINVSGVTNEMLKALRENGNDGITIEVNSYYTGITDQEVWNKMKESTVTTMDKTTIRGQITTSKNVEDKAPVIISYTYDKYKEEYGIEE